MHSCIAGAERLANSAVNGHLRFFCTPEGTAAAAGDAVLRSAASWSRLMLSLSATEKTGAEAGAGAGAAAAAGVGLPDAFRAKVATTEAFAAPWDFLDEPAVVTMCGAPGLPTLSTCASLLRLCPAAGAGKAAVASPAIMRSAAAAASLLWNRFNSSSCSVVSESPRSRFFSAQVDETNSGGSARVSRI